MPWCWLLVLVLEHLLEVLFVVGGVIPTTRTTPPTKTPVQQQPQEHKKQHDADAMQYKSCATQMQCRREGGWQANAASKQLTDTVV